MKNLYLFLLLFVNVSYSYAQTVTLTNSSNTNADVNIAVGGSTTLNFTRSSGSGSWNFSLYDGVNDRYYTSTTTTKTITVAPSSTRRYYVRNVTTPTGTMVASNTPVKVIVGTVPSITLNTPPSLTACVGGTIEIPFTKNGTWNAGAEVFVDIMNSAGTSVVWSPIDDGFQTSPVILPIPTWAVSTGTYKVRLYSKKPYTVPVLSTYSITVGASGCQSPKASIYNGISDTFNCVAQIVYATPEPSAGYTYEWFKNGVSMGAASSWNQTVFQQTGNYTVRVTNSITGFDQTSPVHSIPLINVAITVIMSPTTVNCGSSISNTLISQMTGPSYQWLKQNSNLERKPIIGANNSSYTATSTGDYYIYIYDDECQYEGYPTVNNIPWF